MNILTMEQCDLHHKRVLIREDLNVPIFDGMITSDQRLQAALPTLKAALQQGAAVMVLSHLGRPEAGHYDPRYSLRPVADYLAAHLDYPVRLVSDYLEGVEVHFGELLVCENVRFNPGEKENDPALAKKLAALCDVFVMDAFGTAHREHASTVGIAQYAPVAVAGPLLMKELEAIGHVFQKPEKPVVMIVGGAKISTKLSLLEHMMTRIDYLIPGGGIANTFLKAQGYAIGNSLYEEALVDAARSILERAPALGCTIVLPQDVVVGKQLNDTCPAFNKSLAYIAADDKILDMGSESVHRYIQVIDKAKTIVWNGPVGVFEYPQFAYGTRAIALAIAKSDAFSIAGGGETLAAIDQYNLAEDISYISTGGGAFLTCLEGKTLPAVAVLAARAAECV